MNQQALDGLLQQIGQSRSRPSISRDSNRLYCFRRAGRCRRRPIKIVVGPASPFRHALIEVAAGDEGIRRRIAQSCHAGQLNGREIRRFVHHHLCPVKIPHGCKWYVAPLIDLTVYAPVGKQLTHALEQTKRIVVRNRP
jgi:hypothetical protein